MDEFRDIDDATIARWMAETRRATKEDIERLRGTYPDMALLEAARREGLVSSFALERLVGDVLQGLGLPDRIGSLRIQHEIRRGGMGIVLRARDEELDRDVVVKLLPPALALQPESTERFTRECRAVARLDHPAIVRLYQTGDLDGIPYAVMEHIRGEPLDEVLARRKRGEGKESPFPGKPGPILCAFAEIADALEYAHRHGIVHRDVKPSNLIVDASGKLHLIDFGLALLDDDRRITFTGDLIGTPSYMSPEQVAQGRLAVGHATDIYSLGATVYEALAGQPPFVEANRVKLFENILFHDPAPPSSRAAVPAEADAIAMQCLRKDPKLRYASCADLARDLRGAAAGEPISARRWGRLRRSLHALHRLPARAGHGAIALLLVVLPAIAWLPLQGLAPSHDTLLARIGLLVSGLLSFFALVLIVRGASTTALRRDPVRTIAVALASLILMSCTLPLWEKVSWRWWQLGDFRLGIEFTLGFVGAIVWMQICSTAPRRLEIATFCAVAVLQLALSFFPTGIDAPARAYLAVRWLLLPCLAGLGSLLLLVLLRIPRPRMGLWIAAHVAAAAGLAAGLHRPLTGIP